MFGLCFRIWSSYGSCNFFSQKTILGHEPNLNWHIRPNSLSLQNPVLMYCWRILNFWEMCMGDPRVVLSRILSLIWDSVRKKTLIGRWIAVLFHRLLHPWSKILANSKYGDGPLGLRLLSQIEWVNMIQHANTLVFIVMRISSITFYNQKVPLFQHECRYQSWAQNEFICVVGFNIGSGFSAISFHVEEWASAANAFEEWQCQGYSSAWSESKGGSAHSRANLREGYGSMEAKQHMDWWETCHRGTLLNFLYTFIFHRLTTSWIFLQTCQGMNHVFLSCVEILLKCVREL